MREQRTTQLAADPAKYVLRDETVAKAYEAMNAAEGEARAEASRAYPAALALQECFMQRWLTNAMVDEIDRSFNEQMSSDDGLGDRDARADPAAGAKPELDAREAERALGQERNYRITPDDDIGQGGARDKVR